ncbi:MAG: hypothetical protein P8181_03400 [bacterium]
MTTIANAAAKSTVLGLALCALLWNASRTADALENTAVSDARLAVERCLEKTAEFPASLDAWLKLSEAYLTLAAVTGNPGRIASADSAVSIALALGPVDVEVLNQLSRVRSAQHRYEDILGIEHESIYYDVAKADSWGLAGDAYMDLGRYRSADSCYYKMYEMNPDSKSQMRLARRMFDLGDFDVAVRHMEAAIDDARTRGESGYPVFADAQVRLGRMYLSRGDWDAAMSRADSSLAVVPGYGAALELKAEIYYYRRTFVDSRKMYERLAQQLAYEESRQRRDVYTYDLLAWAYFKNKNYNLAWSSIALALRNEAKHPRIIYHAAVIAKAAGKKEKYETYAAKVRKLNPRFEAMYGSL